MTLGEEASRSLSGAWALLRRDPAAPTAFNATLAGVWRSFFAAVLLLPLYLASLALIGPTAGTEQQPPGATRWIVYFLIYVIGWAAWPLIAYYMTRLMDCGEKLLGYVVAYNWSQLLTQPFLIGLDVFGRILGREAFFDNVTCTNMRVAIVQTAMIGPTEEYAGRGETAEQCAARVVRALEERPVTVDGLVGSWVEVANLLVPRLTDLALAVAHVRNPDSAAARGARVSATVWISEPRRKNSAVPSRFQRGSVPPAVVTRTRAPGRNLPSLLGIVP